MNITNEKLFFVRLYPEILFHKKSGKKNPEIYTTILGRMKWLAKCENEPEPSLTYPNFLKFTHLTKTKKILYPLGQLTLFVDFDMYEDFTVLNIFENKLKVTTQKFNKTDLGVVPISSKYLYGLETVHTFNGEDVLYLKYLLGEFELRDTLIENKFSNQEWSNVKKRVLKPISNVLLRELIQTYIKAHVLATMPQQIVIDNVLVDAINNNKTSELNYLINENTGLCHYVRTQSQGV